MIVEFLLAWATEIHGVVLVFALVTAVVAGLAVAGRAVVADGLPSYKEFMAPPVGRIIAISAGLFLLTTVPTVDSLWRVRVGLLKLELASPENMKAVGGHIEEIVKGLECKHLGVNCPKEGK
jgi:hypothetical protein